MGRGVLILGGGPAGLAAAGRLSARGDLEVRLLEQADAFGGNARTIAWNGHRLDLGSHRLPLNGHAGIIEDLHALLGEDLRVARRRARARVAGRWAPYPLRPRWLIRIGPSDRYLYPRPGIGAIGARLAETARARGADLRSGHRVTRIAEGPDGVTVTATHRGEDVVFRADRVLSALPITGLVPVLEPPPPPEVIRAAGRIRFRALVLVFLEFAVDRFSDYDSHHLPKDGFRVARVSEPKVIADREEPAGRTVLTAEIPCAEGDETYGRSDMDLTALVTEELTRARMDLPGLPTAAHVVRLPRAAPVLGPESDVPLSMVHRHLEGRGRITSLSNPGGGVLDALAAAYAAADRIR
jgi:protoporphyrinogen oxidase